MKLRILFICLAAGACAAEPPAPESGWTLDPAGDLNRFFDCLEAEGTTLVSAHRGGPAPGWPENALETMQRTLAAAPAMLEIDVAQSADGVLFLLHDDTLERTTTGRGRAAETPWAEISRLRLRDGRGKVTRFRPARFAEALALAKGRTVLKVDIKRSARYEDVIAEIRRAGAERRVVPIAATLAQAQRLHRLAPEMMISFAATTEDELDAALAAGLPDDRLMGFTGTRAPDRTIFDRLNGRRIEVIHGTLGGRDSLDRAIAASGEEHRYAEIAAMGVDIIATDRPLEAHAALAAAGRGAKDGVCGIAWR